MKILNKKPVAPRRRALAFGLGLAIAPVVGLVLDQAISLPSGATSSTAGGCYADKYGPGVGCPGSDGYTPLTPKQAKAVGVGVGKVGTACGIGWAAAEGNPLGCLYGAGGGVIDILWGAIAQ